ncbi:hypothetical protein [Xylanimonas ulmi]|uniref:Uncharacterized protein n=1 Tax=Xylanimonas ulmi TaxID=228973 RepID=A0A4Q7LZZ1_9MICO|nr:hypothetical protein [Xylanibacterium ulmi]RZS60421.1 hypothetical protein EV386_0679 [Xylanibacterium ulmi]
MTTTTAAPTTLRELDDVATALARTAAAPTAARRALARPLILGAIFGVVLCLPIFTVG